MLLSAGAEQGWKPQPSEMETWDKLPEGLMIASPANPTGAVLSVSELADICRWCGTAMGCALISDEISSMTEGRREGAFYLFADTTQFENSMEFAAPLSEQSVATTPGVIFGPHKRLSLLTPVFCR